ncbi:arylesterase [Salmonella enterica subsp. enterica serovar Enteritidis]|nr:arylesterase [Salmonella enterica subsp. enterica serovar Enteritidis]
MTRKHFRVIAALILSIFLLRPALAEPYQIVGFGDSLMAGYGLQPGESFPEKLQAALKAKGHDVTVANAGVSGDTSSGGLSRLDWSVPDGAKLVILELGANDMLRGIAPELTAQNLDAMITRLKARNIPILLAGMRAAPNLGPDYQSRFDAIYPDLAKRHGLPLIPFFLEGVTGDPKMVLEDGMHPNAQGVDRMVEEALPVVTPLLPAG